MQLSNEKLADLLEVKGLEYVVFEIPDAEIEDYEVRVMIQSTRRLIEGLYRKLLPTGTAEWI